MTNSTVLAVSLLLSALTHQGVELPIRKIAFASLRRSAVAATLLLAGVGVVGRYVPLLGSQEAFNKNVRAVLAYEHYDVKADAHHPDCWLVDDAPFEQMSRDCMAQGENTIAVWGDSYSARLSTGLRPVFGADRITQYSRNACPPIIDDGQSACHAGNVATLQSLREHKPKLLIMFGAWAFYNSDWSPTAPTSLALIKTIKLLKDAGISRILLLGPPPTFPQTLPTLIFQKMQSDRSTEIPARLLIDDTAVRDVSLQLSEWSKKLGISYFSAIDLFCNSQGCLTVVPGTETDLVAWDTSHLTSAGAKYLSKAIEQQLPSTVGLQ
jgi:hypothetical protein